MARRPAAGGRVGLRAMLSLEPWTIRGCGYPDLLATGESCNGDSIHDRQHPHDLFMELAGEYDRPLTSALRWQLYGGLAGEPALGPAGFPHRLSAMSNLVAPIGHHWLDATHITFGLVTTGIYGQRWKGESSLFNGREPDEQRTDLDLAPLDSYSGRLWFLPTARLALQVSAGRLDDAEAPHGVGPLQDIVRITASATYQAAIGSAGFWATTLAWGVNREAGIAYHTRSSRRPLATRRRQEHLVRTARGRGQGGPRASRTRVNRRVHSRKDPGRICAVPRSSKRCSAGIWRRASRPSVVPSALRAAVWRTGRFLASAFS